MDFTTVAQLVEQVAAEELTPRFTHVQSRQKADGSLITEADDAIQARLMAELEQRWPDIRLLGEEMSAEQQQSVLDGGGQFWCLDPLDGTTNFAAGLPYFAVSLALIEDGRAVGGIVYDPMRRECFQAELGKGAMLNGEPLAIRSAPQSLSECIAMVDMKRLTPELALRLVSGPPYRSQRGFGAVALEWCWLAAGRCHLYLHGQQNIWDYAAGSLVFQEAGGVLCLTDRPDGDCDPRLFLGSRTGVGAVSGGLFEAWRDYLSGRSSS